MELEDGPFRRAGDMSPTILENCTGCGRCVSACPLRALTLNTDGPDGFGRKKVSAAPLRCNGCGTCVPACPRNSLNLPTL